MTTEETAQVEKKGWLTKRAVILTSWASVSTALLLMVLIGGAIYLNDVKSRCEDDDVAHEVKKNTEDYGKGKQEIIKDNDQQSELIIKKNEEGAITMMMAIDYKKKISTTYLTEFDMCFMAAGSAIDWAEEWEAEEPEKPNNITGKWHDGETRYKMVNKVTDMSIVPKVIRPFCEGKDVYWLDPQSEGETDGEEKRETVGSMCAARGSGTSWWFGCTCVRNLGNRYAWVNYCIVDGWFIRHCYYSNTGCAYWTVNCDCDDDVLIRA